ncbi:hypothetical protein WJX74_001389 [Apatococcus lobatus]|uniref:EamA domain-containing protein n=2 Tax=Apatococcus TaxID=904362 RepID=A0AAW1SRU8_9CHLO
MQYPRTKNEDISPLLVVQSQQPVKPAAFGWARSWLTKCARLFWNSGAACCLAYSTAGSSNAAIVRLVQLPVFEIVFFRSVVGCIATCAVAVSSGTLPALGGQKGTRGLLAVRGIAGSVSMIGLYQSILMLPLADAITIGKLTPIFTALLAALLIAEPLTWAIGAFSFLAIVGVVLVAHPPFLMGGHEAWSSTRMAGVSIDLAGALAQAIAAIAVRKIQTAEPASVVAFWYHAVSLLVAATALASGWPEFPVLPGPAAAAGLFAIGVGSYLGQICWARAFQIGNAARMSAITYSEIVYAHIFGLTIWHERETALGVVGTIFIVGGAFGATMEQKARSKPLAQEMEMVLPTHDISATPKSPKLAQQQSMEPQHQSSILSGTPNHNTDP